MFQVVKQGDSYRLLYSAKDFTTGLSDVSAIPYNPSGAAQTAVSLSELGSSGIYYADFDTTGKTLGAWSFKVDSTSKKAPAFTRIQIVDGDTLNDTVFEKLDTMLDSVLSNQTVMDGKLDVIDQNVDDVEAIVTSGTYGNAALKTILDTISSAVQAMDKNSEAKIAIIDQMLIPGSGSNTYKFFFRFYDSNGNMEDPDDQDAGAEQAMVAVSVANSAGTDRSANLSGLSASTQGGLKWLTRVSEGVFSAIYTVASTHAVEDLIFSFDLLEQTAVKSFAAISRTASSASDYGSRFDAIDSALTTIDGNVDDIEGHVTNVTYGLSALQTLIAAIQTDLDNGTDGLGAIKAAVDSNNGLLTNATYGLSALKTILDTINTNTNGVSADLTSIKGTGFTSATDSLRAIAEQTRPGGVCI